MDESKNLDLKVGQGRFIIKSKLGGGSFGDIYRGIDTWRGRDVAVKMEQCKARHPQLNYESKIYKLLHQNTLEVVGVPEMHFFGVEGDFNIMVMDMCGPSLEDLFNYCNRRFSAKTVFMLAEQILHRIEFLHSKHIIHRDIKPENFVMGVGDKGHHLYIVDFGLSKKYWDSSINNHIPYKEGKPMTGTARYCSVNTHLGIEQSRRDDLESIGFLLLYLYRGHLPWQGIRVADPSQKTVRIGEKKIGVGLDFLCKDEPSPFLKYLKYCRGLKFEETPDYEMLRRLFVDYMEREGIVRDWIFDWVDVRRAEIAAEEAENKSNEPSVSQMSVGPPSTSPHGAG